MRKYMLLFAILLLSSFVMPYVAHAFSDEITHPALTQEIANLYDALHPEKPLMPAFRAALIGGSQNEDTPPRWLNHFFDPVHNRGWSGRHLSTFSSSTITAVTDLLFSSEKPAAATTWMRDDVLQDAYRLYGGNHTWEEGIREYAAGDVADAYKTVGHVLHLLEDLAVPEHSRDDTHAHEISFLTGDPGSAHEAYALRWSTSTIKMLKITEGILTARTPIPRYAKPEEHLAAMAKYSNQYFFSRDTINDSSYTAPVIRREDAVFAYGADEEGKEFPIASIERKIGSDGTEEKSYFLLERTAYLPLFDAYFSRVAPKIVLHGVGVLELFLAEAGRAAANPALVPRSLSKGKLSLPMVSVVGTGAKIKDGVASLLATVKNIFGKKSPASTVIVPKATSTIQKTVVPAATSSVVVISSSTVAKKTTPKAPAKSTTPAPAPKPATTPKITTTKPTSTSSSTTKAPAKATSTTTTTTTTKLHQSSTAVVSTSPVVVPPVFGPIVISEVQVAGVGDANDEFIELYNPNDFAVPIGHWSLQYLSGAADSFEQVKKRNLEEGMKIEPHHYFLFARGLSTSGDDGYAGSIVPDITQRTFSLSGASTGGALFLVKNQEAIVSAVDADIVDMTGYGANVITPVRIGVPAAGKSVERKALVAEACVVATGSAELAGNECDTDGADDFSIRTKPDPQNTTGLPEPRNGTVSSTNEGDLTISYNTSSLRAMFTWASTTQASGTVTYRLLDISATEVVSLYETTSTFSHSMVLDEVGREYEFGLETRTEDGSVSMATSSLSLPGYVKSAYFYADPRAGATHYIADLFYDSVPFIPLRFSVAAIGEMSWQGMVLYQNRLPNRVNMVLSTISQLVPDDETNVVSTAVFAVTPKFQSPFGGGLGQSTWGLPTEDGHVQLAFASNPNKPLTPNDYFTLAYYDFSRSGGGSQDLSLVAVDATKYYFSSSTPQQSAPTTPTNLGGEAVAEGQEVMLTWGSSTDSDSADEKIQYEIGYATSSSEFSWKSVGKALNGTLSLKSSSSYVLAIRAVDDFWNASPAATISWETPEFPDLLPEQLDHNEVIGRSIDPMGQRISILADEIISGVALWAGNDGSECCATTYLELREDVNGAPNVLLATSTVVTLSAEADKEVIYEMPPTSLSKGKQYWLVPVAGEGSALRLYGSYPSAYPNGNWVTTMAYDAYFRFVR